MAHMIETMAFFGEAPWHIDETRDVSLKVTEEETKDWEAFCKRAGLDWSVDKSQLYTSGGLKNGVPQVISVPSHVAIRRTTDNAILGVVGEGFEPVQNHDRFKWFDPFVKSGQAKYVTAGSLNDGKRVWCLVEIIGAEDSVRKGDTVKGFIMLAGAFDGTMSEHAGYTKIRVVCANTLASAINDAGSSIIKVKHRKNVMKSLDAVRDVMDLAREEFRANMDQYKKLCNMTIKKKDVEKYVKIVFDVPLDAKEYEKEVSTRTKNQIDEVIRLAIKGKGNFGDTYWDAYNGVTEFLNWQRGNSADSRMNSVWFGDSAKMSKRALDVGLELVAA